MLLDHDFEINVKSKGCSPSDKLYGYRFDDNDLMFISLNDNILYIDKNKKKKWEDVNVTYLWHCQLGHISESKINKLYKEKFFD